MLQREPWWNRKAETSVSAAASRRAKFLSVHRVSSGSAAADDILIESATPSPAMVESSSYDTSTVDSSQKEHTAQYTDDDIGDDLAAAEVIPGDVTPTRDELPVWQVIDNTVDEVDHVNDNATHDNDGDIGINVIEKNIACTDDGRDHDKDKGDKGSNIVKDNQKEVAVYGPIVPCSSLQTIDAMYSSFHDDDDGSNPSAVSDGDVSEKSEVEKPTTETRTLSKTRKRFSSVESNRSSNTLSSERSSTRDRSSTRERSPPTKRSHYEKSHKHSKQKEHNSTTRRSKKSRSQSPGSPRRPRALKVSYDKLREQNGTALPVRTYDPLDPLGMRATQFLSTDHTKPYWSRKKTLHSSNDSKSSKSSSYDKYSESSVEKSRRSSSEKSSKGLHKSKRTRSPSKERHSSRKAQSPASPSRRKSSDKFKEDKSSSHANSSSGNKSFSKHSSSSHHHSSRYARAKSVYSSHVKRSTVKKPEKTSDQSGWLKKLTADGIGIQKIRPNQRKTFMATCVEDYSLQTNGCMAKELKPLLAFKVGNPQFVSEFYEKKTELNELPMVRSNLFWHQKMIVKYKYALILHFSQDNKVQIVIIY